MAQRKFHCRSCGANVEYEPGSTHLQCPYCSAEHPIPTSEEEIKELDFDSALSQKADTSTFTARTIHCGGCGATTQLEAHVTADRCAFCDSPLVEEPKSLEIFKPKSMLPFGVDQKAAKETFKNWLGSRWFAPNDLKLRARKDGLDGIYIPYWTYDSSTESYYRGQRGDYYYETESYSTTEGGEEVTKTREVRKTRWRSTSGVVWESFDDILVPASNSIPRNLAEKLEPWDLPQLVPYQEQYLSGFGAECYQVDLREGFEFAKQTMEEEIRQEVKRDIGGDEQRISSVRTAYEDITFKHILLPVWVSAFKYQDKVYRVLVNARTGEIQGERPYSVVKITLLVLAICAVIGLIYYLTQK